MLHVVSKFCFYVKVILNLQLFQDTHFQLVQQCCSQEEKTPIKGQLTTILHRTFIGAFIVIDVWAVLVMLYQSMVIYFCTYKLSQAYVIGVETSQFFAFSFVFGTWN